MRNAMPRVAPLAVALILSSAWCRADDSPFKVESFEGPAPKEVSPAIKALLGGSAFKVSQAGKPFLEVWTASAIPANLADPDGTVLYPGMPIGAVWGVAKIVGDMKDIRGQVLRPGVYTLRYALQPSDGDHLGASDFRDYLVLLPAETDVKAEFLMQKHVEKASTKVSRTAHPATLMIRTKAGKGGKLPELTKIRPAEDDLWVVDLEFTFRKGADDKPAKRTVGIVVVGLAKAG